MLSAKNTTLNWRRCIGYGPSYVQMALRLQLQFQFGCGVSFVVGKLILDCGVLTENRAKYTTFILTKMHWLWTDQVVFDWLSDCSCNFSLVVEFQVLMVKVHLFYEVLSFLINEAKHSTLNWQRCTGYGPRYVQVALLLQLQFQFGCGVSSLIGKSTFVLWSFKLFDKWSKTLNLKLIKIHWLWTNSKLE